MLLELFPEEGPLPDLFELLLLMSLAVPDTEEGLLDTPELLELRLVLLVGVELLPTDLFTEYWFVSEALLFDLLIGLPPLPVVNDVTPDPLLAPPPYPETLFGLETDVLVLLFMALDDFMAAVAFTGEEYEDVEDTDDEGGFAAESGVDAGLLEEDEDADRFGIGGRLAIPLAFVLRKDNTLAAFVELPDWGLLDEVDDFVRELLDFKEEFGVFLPPEIDGDPPFLSLEYILFPPDGSPLDPLDRLPVELRPVVGRFLLEDPADDFPEVDDDV
ncbi:hypothetical protein KP79_PYT19246 [Mizuhopecten yessoensis]|uniref:Uncharacterized protein n=1 Tax=Mizuhopecten yessoensis TaxID=6573 RepID=A0A210PSG0_MIZYE|nr:hypothetical protein KP79_PYT19246 [Mizuhopecten yessoensis]